jgi:hypothetical protein
MKITNIKFNGSHRKNNRSGTEYASKSIMEILEFNFIVLGLSSSIVYKAYERDKGSETAQELIESRQIKADSQSTRSTEVTPRFFI